MGCECASIDLYPCKNLASSCTKGGSCNFTDIEQAEISANSFHRPTFVKWLADAISESMHFQSNPDLGTSFQFLKDGTILMDDQEMVKMREEMISRASTKMNSSNHRQSRRESRYDTVLGKRKKLGPDCVRQIILDAFTKFRNHELSERKLKQLEDKVFEDCYFLLPDEAAKRILNLMDTVDDKWLIESELLNTPNTLQESQKTYSFINSSCIGSSAKHQRDISIRSISL